MQAAALIFLFSASAGAGAPLGIWIMNAARSTLAAHPRPKRLTIRIESRAKGEVFSLDRIEPGGRTTTPAPPSIWTASHAVPKTAGVRKPNRRRRVDSQTVETLRTCGPGWIRFVRLSSQPNELVLELTEHQTGGFRFERHLVLERLR